MYESMMRDGEDSKMGLSAVVEPCCRTAPQSRYYLPLVLNFLKIQANGGHAERIVSVKAGSMELQRDAPSSVSRARLACT